MADVFDLWVLSEGQRGWYSMLKEIDEGRCIQNLSLNFSLFPEPFQRNWEVNPQLCIMLSMGDPYLGDFQIFVGKWKLTSPVWCKVILKSVKFFHSKRFSWTFRKFQLQKFWSQNKLISSFNFLLTFLLNNCLYMTGWYETIVPLGINRRNFLPIYFLVFFFFNFSHSQRQGPFNTYEDPRMTCGFQANYHQQRPCYPFCDEMATQEVPTGLEHCSSGRDTNQGWEWGWSWRTMELWWRLCFLK